MNSTARLHHVQNACSKPLRSCQAHPKKTASKFGNFKLLKAVQDSRRTHALGPYRDSRYFECRW